MTSPIVSQESTTSNGIEATWEPVKQGQMPDSAYRTTFRQAVADVASKAKEVLHDSHGRIDSAVKMVLNGDVQILGDGTARVASQSKGETIYRVVNGSCDCLDFPKAPSGFCKHRLAYGICKRATALTQERLHASNGQPQEDAPVEVSETPQERTPQSVAVDHLPTKEDVKPPVTHHEAPASMNCYVTIGGYKVQVTLRGDNEQQLLLRMGTFLSQFPPPEPATPASNGQVSTKQAEPAAPEGWCRRHDLQMKLNTNDKGSWWSHRLSDGSWCHGK